MRFSQLLVGLFFTQSLTAAETTRTFEGAAQGTTWHVIVRGTATDALQAEIDSTLKDFDRVFSNYRPDSDISRFNRQQSTDWFPVEADLVQLVDHAAAISQKSRGAFDLTIGPLLRVWGFGPFKTKDHTLPSEAAIQEAQKDVDYRKLLTQKKPPALKKLNPRIYVDLSGIAQGYSVDRVAALLEKRGFRDYLVEIGGEVRTRGSKAPGQPWTLGVDAPTAESGSVAALLHVEGRALTTAGDYRDYFEKDGKRYSHTIDPRTGKPVTHNLASVTVMAMTGWAADGWDTALMVLGPEATRKLAPELKDMSIYLILREGQSFRTESLGGFDKYLTGDSKR